ncbi:MAG TPA: ATP-binding protein [Kofleriaceae bacterium]
MGLFAFAAVHYAIQWWFSRNERVLLVFAVQCALYVAFTWTMLWRRQVTTLAETQTALDTNVTLALILFAVIVQFYALLGNRRDRTFRLLVVGVLASLALLNQWAPLRGTVLELKPMQLPGGGTGLLPIRTPPGAGLALLYLTALVVQAYGVFVACTIWKRDRLGTLLIILGAAAIEAGAAIGALVDFAGLRVPYVGALPHAFFVLCMALFLAREYSARAAQVVVANRHFETVFEHAPIGMAILAPAGEVLRVNRALCRMLGMSADVLCTQRLRDLTHEDDAGPDEVESRLLAGELQTYSVEKCFVRTDGERVWVLLAMSVVPDDRGRPTRVIAQLQDITELRTHRDRLEELVATRTHELRDAKDDAERANAAKSQFLAQMSHEIRTPLGVILLYAQLLQRELDEPQRAKIDIIFSSGKHLQTLLTDVLEMSKIEAGRAELVEDRLDPWAMLDEVEHMFAVQSASKGIELTIDRSAELPRLLLGDGGKVKQVLINLVSNAVKFTKQGAVRVKASARALADEKIVVEIVVADTGIGIATPDRERMFKPFEQLKPSAHAGGTGLGLAISLSHARLMGGDLTVESTLGVGATFTFTFLAKRVGTEPTVEASEALPLVATATPRKALIVDDLKENRDVLAELLAQSSFETRTAEDGPGALAIDADWSPDLVLIDLRMPGMDGLEAILRMRAAGSRAAIGVLSASALADDEREALAIGADFFMRKPCDERELFERIARVLAVRDRAGLG